MAKFAVGRAVLVIDGKPHDLGKIEDVGDPLGIFPSTKSWYLVSCPKWRDGARWIAEAHLTDAPEAGPLPDAPERTQER